MMKMMKEIGKKAMSPVSFMLDKAKKLIWFLEIGPVKIFLSLTRRHSRMSIIYIFNLKQEDKKVKKRTFVEYLMGYNDFIREFALCFLILPLVHISLTHFNPMFHFYTPWKHHKSFFWRFDGVLKWSIGLKWVNLVYVAREKSQYLLYYNIMWNTHFQEQK